MAIPNNRPTHVYIDGVKRKIVNGSDAILIVDSDDLPGRPCAQHNIGSSAYHALLRGMSVRTLGHTYSFIEPAVSVTLVKPRPALPKAPPPALSPTLRQRVARGIHKLANLIGGTS
jgi:hypothetical protein